MTANSTENAAAYSDYLWRAVGGNPLALKIAAPSLWLHDAQTLSQTSLQEIFGRSEAALKPELRRAWYAFALFPPGKVDAKALCRAWPTWITSDDVSELLRLHLVDRVMSQELACSLTMGARRYIEESYQVNQSIRMTVDKLIDELADDRPVSWEVIEHIL